jgi:4-amino-4-deoxychorismate lyase
LLKSTFLGFGDWFAVSRFGRFQPQCTNYFYRYLRNRCFVKTKQEKNCLAFAMSLLLETIRFHKARFENLSFHSARMNRSRRDLFGCQDRIDLEKVLHGIDKPKNIQMIYKCRILYAQTIQTIQFEPYSMRSIQFLKLIEDNEIDYSYKWNDRKSLNKYVEQLNSINQSIHKDILIIKNGLITDTSYSNILLNDGKYWFTPSEPLLRGTQREFLLDKQLISEKKIFLSDLKYFQQAMLINSMLPFDLQRVIPIENIAWE